MKQEEQRLVEQLVSLIALKRTASNTLPKNSTLRSLIMSEPDSLPYSEAMAKIQVYARLLDSELQKSN